MKAVNKLCISALVLGGIGCAVFGSLMVASGQEGTVLDCFSVHLGNSYFGIHFGDQGSGSGFFDEESNIVGDQDSGSGFFDEVSSMDFSSPVDMGDEIDELDFEIGAAKLIIEPGDSFSITAENVNIYTCGADGGIWRLEAASTSVVSSAAQITVIVPADRVLDLNLEVGAGELQIGAIQVNDFVVSIGAGTAKTELMDVRGMVDIEVGAGSLSAKMTEPANVYIDCGMGSVSLELAASQDVYDIFADCGLGSVKAGTLHIDGAGDKEYTSSSSEYQMNIDCGMGSVRISFDASGSEPA